MTIFSKTILGKIIGGAGSILGLVVPGVTAITNVASNVLDKVSSAAQTVVNGTAAATAKLAAINQSNLNQSVANENQVLSASASGFSSPWIWVAVVGVGGLIIFLTSKKHR